MGLSLHMNRLLLCSFALLGMVFFAACDSHSWEKETSHLFHKKGHGHAAEKHAADSHAAPVTQGEAHGEKKAAH
jgi:hypothetical protein